MKIYRKMLAGFVLMIGVLFSMTVYGSTESETEEKQSDSDILVVYFASITSPVGFIVSHIPLT